MKPKLLIADDEEIERLAVQLQLRKAFPQLELLEPAGNGIELLESVRRQEPDIVMADIEMPGMNGLRALEQLREEGHRPHILIMTAYSSEHYLKESISLRVYAYLEKPIRRDRMESTVRSLLEELEQIRRKDAALERMRSAVRSLHGMIQAELMSIIESDEADPNQAGELLDLLELQAERFLVMTFSLADLPKDGSAPYAQNIAELNAFDEVRKLARAKGWLDGHILHHRMSFLVPVEIQVEQDKDYRLRQAACSAADEILQKLGGLQGIRIGIGMSTTDPKLLQRSRQQSIQALYLQDKRAAVCHYEDQPLPVGREHPFLKEEAKLTESLQNGSLEQATACVRRCFEAVPTWADFDSLRNQVFEMLLAVNRQCGMQIFGELLTDVSEQLLRCNDRSCLEETVVRFCAKSIRKRNKDDNEWQENIIQQATRYIDACYNTDLSLETTAEAVGVSRFYLSRLFKTRLWTNYSAYLTEKRVHMAEALMRTQRWRSNREIAELVGFRDPDYFGKVFKKQLGCTITEYREQIK